MLISVEALRKAKQHKDLAAKEAKEAKYLLKKQQYDEAADKCSSSILNSFRAIVNMHDRDADNYADMSSCLTDLIEQGKISSEYFKILSLAMGAASAVNESDDLQSKKWFTMELYINAMEMLKIINHRASDKYTAR